MIGENILKVLKINTKIILMMNLKNVKKAFGFITKISLLILLALTMSTCSGVRLMSGTQTLGKQIDYSTFSGKLVKRIPDVTECAILKIEDLGSPLWHQGKLLTWQPYQAMLGLEYYPSLGQMQKRCLLIKSFQYPLTIRSFSNRYKMVWIDQKPNWPIVYPHPDLLDVKSRVQVRGPRSSRDWTPPSTGRIQVTTPTMERSLNSSSMMSRGSGRGQTTSSTTGVSRKQH